MADTETSDEGVRTTVLIYRIQISVVIVAEGWIGYIGPSHGGEPEKLREEIEELEDRIEELTEFRSGSQFHTRAGGEP